MSKSMTHAALLLTVSIAALTAVPVAANAQANPNVDGVLVTGRTSQLAKPAATGSRLGISVLETPASVEVLSGDLIRARGDLSIVDAVTRATGVTTAANGGNGGTGLSVRGFTDQGSVMQLYDGVRLYPGAGTITFPFDPWTVERIEVLRGPASVLFGQGAIGGVINVVPRKPNTQATEIDLEAGYGTNNTWHAAGGAGGPISQQLAYRADVSLRGSDGWVNNGKSSSQAASASLAWAPTERLNFTLSNDYANQHPMDYYGVPALNGKFVKRLRRQNYEVADSVIHYIDNQTRLNAEWKASDAITVTNTLYRLHTNRTWHNLDTYGFASPAATQIDRTDYFGGEHHQNQIGDQASAVLNSRFGAMENALVVGVDLNRIRFQHVNNFTFRDTSGGGDTVNVVGFNPGLFVNPAYILPAYRTITHQSAVFAEDRLKVSDQLSVVAGIRSERANVKRSSNTYDAALNPTGLRPAFSKTFKNTSYRVGVVYQPTTTSSVYGQYTTGTDPLGSLITTNASQTAFKMAKGRQIEVGYKQTFMGGRGEFSAAAYKIKKTNLLTRDFSAPNLVQQIGGQSSRGVEATLIFPVTDQLSVEANAAVLKAKFDRFFENVGGVATSRAGNRPTNAPNVSSNVFVVYAPITRLRLQAGLRYVGSVYTDNSNSAANRLPEYVVYDAGASFAVNDKVDVRLNLYNLTDKLYATNAYNPGQWILGRPRAVDVTVSARF